MMIGPTLIPPSQLQTKDAELCICISDLSHDAAPLEKPVLPNASTPSDMGRPFERPSVNRAYGRATHAT